MKPMKLIALLVAGISIVLALRGNTLAAIWLMLLALVLKP